MPAVFFYFWVLWAEIEGMYRLHFVDVAEVFPLIPSPLI